MNSTLTTWNPEDKDFWDSTGNRIAKRNLWISIFCLLLSFSVWFIWSAVVVQLNSVGFNFTDTQLFSLAAIPGLTGATLRIFYSFTVPIFGGRNWTVLSTASLLIPSIWIGFALQDTSTTYSTMLILAALCGLGGGNFSSSMANISFFFPKHKQGMSLGLNAGLGNLGVSVLQLIVPFIITLDLFMGLGGSAQTIKMVGGTQSSLWIQNSAFIWVIPVILATIAAWFGMNNLAVATTPLKEQLVIFKRKHMYITTILYTMSFGSFIGYSAAFPLLIKIQFPDVNPLTYAFLGPMLGALLRPAGGWMADYVKSGAWVTFFDVIMMIASMFCVLYFINPAHKSFLGFFLSFLVLFVTTGIANGSVFKIIADIFPPKERAPALGFSSAIAAYGAFFIPKSFAYSLELTHQVNGAFYLFILFYLICLVLTWWYYSRPTAEKKC